MSEMRQTTLPICPASLMSENAVLCHALGAAQRCSSRVIAAQRERIHSLEAQLLRLRAELIVRDTLLACHRDSQG